MRVLWGLVLALAAIIAVARVARDRGGLMPSPRPSPPPAAAPPAAPAPPDPLVPLILPTPAPGLDRQLAGDYRAALEDRGVKVRLVTIVDERSTGGARRVEVIYETATDGTPAALHPEVARIAAPAANPRLAADRIVVRPYRAAASLGTIAMSIVDLDRWLKVQIDDDEFYRRWVVEPPGR